MDIRSFFIRLTLIGCSTGALLAALHFLFPALRPHWAFSIASVALFMLICTGLFFMGLSAARGTNKYAFNNLVSITVLGKMVLAIVFLFGYQKAAKPENVWFVGIFLLCYVVFTVYEVWFMTKLSRLPQGVK